MSSPDMGKLTVGQPVFVIPERQNSRTSQEPIPAEVTKVGRVWAVVTEPNGRSWQMHIAKQSQNTGYGYGGARFVTREQYDHEQRRAVAQAVLHAAKVSPEFDSPWRTGERLLALAEFITTYDAANPA